MKGEPQKEALAKKKQVEHMRYREADDSRNDGRMKPRQNKNKK
jgi:hypothetical protein